MIKTYENYITDLIKFKFCGIKVGDKVKFKEDKLLMKSMENIIWVVSDVNYKEGKFLLVSDNEEYQTEIHISDMDEIQKLEDHEVAALKYNL